MPRPRTFTPLEEASIIAEFNSSDKVTSTTLALKHGVSSRTIRRIIEEYKKSNNITTKTDKTFFTINIANVVEPSNYTETNDILLNNKWYSVMMHCDSSDIGSLLSSITEDSEVTKIDHEYYNYMITCKVFDKIETHIVSIIQISDGCEFENSTINFFINKANTKGSFSNG